jgi:hypothetical protein
MLAGVTRRGDDLERADDVAVAHELVGLIHHVIQHAARRDDPRAGRLLQRNRGRRVIAVTMGDENGPEIRHGRADRGDVRVDRRTGIDDRVVVEEIRACAVERERAGIRGGD